MKANVCDICRKVSNRTGFDVCGRQYYIFVRSGYKSEERNGRVPRMRYNIADICFDCLRKLFNNEMAAIIGQRTSCAEEPSAPENTSEARLTAANSRVTQGAEAAHIAEAATS